MQKRAIVPANQMGQRLKKKPFYYSVQMCTCEFVHEYTCMIVLVSVLLLTVSILHLLAIVTVEVQ